MLLACDVQQRCEQIRQFFQLLLSFFTIAVNLYCVLAILLVKKMRKMDFYLVLLQSVFDLLTSGLFSGFYNSVMVVNYVEDLCDEWKKFRKSYDYELTGLRIEPE